MATSPRDVSISLSAFSSPQPVKKKKSKEVDEKESRPLVKAPPPIQRDFFAPLTGSLARQKRFVMVGDTGTGSKDQYAVARQMEAQYERKPYASVLNLGDILYKLKTPEDYTTKIADPYRLLFAEDVRPFSVIGNHDRKKRDVNELFTYMGGARPFYQFTLGSGNSRADFFALDTTILTPGRNGCFRTKDSTEEERHTAKRLAQQQIAWLKEALARSTAPMKVVYGHYPMFSDGANATSDSGELLDEDRYNGQKELEAQLAPIFKQYGVKLYVAGHLHHYEKPKNVDGTFYMVSGAGGGLEDEPDKIPKGTDSLIHKLHFVSCETTDQGIAYEAISDTGEIFDSGLIPNDIRARVPARRSNTCGNICGTITTGTVACFKGIGSLLAKCCPSFLTRQPQPQKDAAFMV